MDEAFELIDIENPGVEDGFVIGETDEESIIREKWGTLEALLEKCATPDLPVEEYEEIWEFAENSGYRTAIAIALIPNESTPLPGFGSWEIEEETGALIVRF